ncbi:hypothetical protein C0J52_19943 [Blattella germanica]|nr:hypothetical protein C0J52_19943 [Blattella germanica]
MAQSTLYMVKVSSPSHQLPVCEGVQVKPYAVLPTATMEVICDEQFAALKFCFCLIKTSAEAYAMLQQAYLKWFKLFKEGRQSISKEGGPEENINTATIIVREDRRITLRAPSDILKISLSATHTLVTEKICI